MYTELLLACCASYRSAFICFLLPCNVESDSNCALHSTGSCLSISNLLSLNIQVHVRL